MSGSRTPTQILILVNVNFPLGKPPLYTYKAFANGSDAQTVKVGPGDQIGWFVRVEAGAGWSQPAYTLAFIDSSILGTSFISVPNGGGSGFFTVQTLTGATKYTLAVSGIVPVSDPQIQVDPNGVLGTGGARGAQYNVRWTAATNLMEHSIGAGPWTGFPAGGVSITAGDSVQFFAVLTPPADFFIDFPSNLNSNVWASPFSVTESSFPATNQGANETTGALTVADKSDGAGAIFQFFAALTDGSLQSAPYALNMT